MILDIAERKLKRSENFLRKMENRWNAPTLTWCRRFLR